MTYFPSEGEIIMHADKEVRIEELIGQLHKSDRYIDLDLMAETMAQEDAIVDHSQTLLDDPGLNEWVDTEGLDKFGPVAIDTLESMVTAEGADWYPRATAGNALVNLAARYPETYERVTAILRSVLPSPEAEPYEDGDPDVWAAIVSDLVQLRDPKAFEIIGQLFDTNLVDTMWIAREDYEKGYRETDPFYRVNPEPEKLLNSHQAMQEQWRRSEARSSAPAPPAASGLAPVLARAPWHVTPSRSTQTARKQKRKTQKASRRKQRRKKKKKRR
jgi:hypothetical protein